MRIGFLAPLKAPTHPTPSGDRTMARRLLAALHALGHETVLLSELRLRDGLGCPQIGAALAARAAAEADRLLASEETRGLDALFTYHSHYKAPDRIGPVLARRLGLPYLIAEPSYAPSRAHGPWAEGLAAALAGLLVADALLVMSARDRPALARIVPPEIPLLDLPPFLGPEPPPPAPREGRPEGPTRLLTVAMMRRGAKLESYVRLARALGGLTGLPWTLDIAGEGPAREAVRAAFAPLGDRVRFHGLLEGPALARLHEGADLFVWPGVAEGYGLAYLDAAAAGLPALAEAWPGPAGLVLDGVTGRLPPPGENAAFAGALSALLDPAVRRPLGAEARRRALTSHGFAAGMAGLAEALAAANTQRRQVRIAS
ncbi:MAG: glycosyltransferase family 4 protein [Alphaproteobacteria bacterium]|nr:glycosyltransferase family 4 protein [Alphaproteobacteria bacterium]